MASIICTDSVSTEAKAEINNHMIGAGFFITLAVTIWTTILIAYRIYYTYNLIPNQKRSRFYNILEIVIESSLLYSLALLSAALINVIPIKQSNFAAVDNAANYLNAILPGVTVRLTIL